MSIQVIHGCVWLVLEQMGYAAELLYLPNQPRFEKCLDVLEQQYPFVPGSKVRVGLN